MDPLIILVISVPIFYVYGIISFFRNFRSKKKVDGATLREAVIVELKRKMGERPHATLTELMKEYEKMAPEAVAPVVVDTAAEVDTPAVVAEEKKEEKVEIQESVWERWYSTNSINLLLYVGAFFIVAAAAIFIGFQWESIPGVMKAILMMLVAGGFLGFGFWFYRIPKIKDAGMTFIAIAAVLVPVCGAAWYTFVLKDVGVPVGVAWLVTSLVVLGIYVYLAVFFRNVFYAYGSTIGTFSLMLSVVHTFSLAKEFYVLAGIVACFGLYLFGRFLKRSKHVFSETLGLPSEVSAQLAMPITLVVGFIMAVGEGELYSLAGVCSGALAAGFYYLGYATSKETWKLAIAEVLFLGTMFVASNWLKVPHTGQYFILAISAVCLSAHAYYYKLEKRLEEADLSLVIAIFTAVLVFGVAAVSNVPPIALCELALAPILIAIVMTIVKNSQYPLLIASFFLAILTYILYMQVFDYGAHPEYLGLLYLGIGLGKYGITVMQGKGKEIYEVGFGATALYGVLSLIFSFQSEPVFILCCLLIATLFFASNLLYKVETLSYGGISFVVLALIVWLVYRDIAFAHFPLIFMVLAVTVYGLSRVLPQSMREAFRNAGLFLAVGNGIFFFLASRTGTSEHGLLERNGVVSAYVATLVWGVEYSLRKDTATAYVTSVLGLCTLLWQLLFMGFENALIFTTPIGLYFSGIGYSRKLLQDPDNEKLFYAVSCAFLLLPPFFMSLGENAQLYSAILGLSGILALFVGISLSQKIFRYSGVAAIILAVLPQTYAYILLLPRWVLVGILGIAFLGFAIFLLLKRKE